MTTHKDAHNAALEAERAARLAAGRAGKRAAALAVALEATEACVRAMKALETPPAKDGDLD